ncbi:signal peptidase II [Evansella cellulosilytica]|uniref:Lipoprotein signal peptidase n=1 Tax=Evansella cellulosilytica (strain ATCC 21833 / DSM 2522 / FERM P-1141 / JCM 9156 / N-4) TaxID=649639 RepID=E6TWS9_EVAC2|nr:signal peptidase II [Evansella cellulosilytica]ADU28762.1 lipoprotein signal peptidase [Evansella cellulosilytica DSM 2522]
MRYYIVALLILLLDQVTKWLVVQNMNIGESIPIINGLFYITSHRNAGAAFGILQGQLWLFIIITIGVSCVLIYLIQTIKKGMNWYGVSLALLLGGAIGNFTDRLFRGGEVVDFINVYIFSYNFPIFNVADMALNVGVVMMLIHLFKEEKRNKKIAK